MRIINLTFSTYIYHIQYLSSVSTFPYRKSLNKSDIVGVKINLDYSSTLLPFSAVFLSLSFKYLSALKTKTTPHALQFINALSLRFNGVSLSFVLCAIPSFTIRCYYLTDFIYNSLGLRIRIRFIAGPHHPSFLLNCVSI